MILIALLYQRSANNYRKILPNTFLEFSQIIKKKKKIYNIFRILYQIWVIDHIFLPNKKKVSD